ncbi:caspase-3-like isoform X2 [Halichondria panicea]|uniref:caspase-3-like isoform X2 n=1 Tax=Halichondria panicea TaxID=6063 RepID=UPI00312B68B5
MSSKLTITDLQWIATELLLAKNKWQDIGLALGLADHDIEGIDGINPQKGLTKMLSTVLQRRADLTWEKIIAVLKTPLVSQDALADKLELNPKIGKPKGQGASKKPELIQKDSSSKAKYDSIDGVPNKDPELNPKIGKPKGQGASKMPELIQKDMSPQPYAMKNRQALIINIIQYNEEMKTRLGSNKDKDALEETLKMLGYTVHIETDLKRDEIIPKVLEHAEKDKHCDSFICCILAHGNQGVVYGSDGEKLEIKDISKALNEVTQLRGNPKIFFFQACQGSDIPIALAEVDDWSSTSSAKPIEIDAAIPKLPRDSDFFYGCASSFETASMRDTNEGSLYIQALCRVLKSKYQEEDLLTMVTRAHYLVAEDERQLKKGKKYVYYQQQPQLVSTLRKQVHF